jgi:alpha-glucosidase
MPWGDQQDGELLAFYRRLVALRRSEPALRFGNRQSIACGGNVVAYRRDTPDQSLAVVINLSEDAQQLEIPGRWASLLLASRAGAVFKPDNTATEIEIPGRSGLVMR